jgi:hypothetical protein
MVLQKLLESAARCRRLASAITDDQMIRNLNRMAADYETQANAIENAAKAKVSAAKAKARAAATTEEVMASSPSGVRLPPGAAERA